LHECCIVDQVVQSTVRQFGDFCGRLLLGGKVGDVRFDDGDICDAIFGKTSIGSRFVTDQANDYIGRIFGELTDEFVLGAC
jgi:hypothetical protein